MRRSATSSEFTCSAKLKMYALLLLLLWSLWLLFLICLSFCALTCCVANAITHTSWSWTPLKVDQIWMEIFWLQVKQKLERTHTHTHAHCSHTHTHTRSLNLSSLSMSLFPPFLLSFFLSFFPISFTHSFFRSHQPHGICNFHWWADRLWCQIFEKYFAVLQQRHERVLKEERKTNMFSKIVNLPRRFSLAADVFLPQEAARPSNCHCKALPEIVVMQMKLCPVGFGVGSGVARLPHIPCLHSRGTEWTVCLGVWKE